MTAQNEKLFTVLKYGLGLSAAAIAAPVVFLALKATLGLIALAIAAGTGLAILRLAPVASMILSNIIVKLIMREAHANPIETMENLKLEKAKELQAADVAIVEFETEVRNYDDEVEGFKEQYPHDAATFLEISQKMHTALEAQKERQGDARKVLDSLSGRIEKARAIYKMSLAAQRVTSLSKSAEAQVFAEIKEKIAFESVRTELNRSFASLNMALSQRTHAPALPAATSVQNKAHNDNITEFQMERVRS